MVQTKWLLVVEEAMVVAIMPMPMDLLVSNLCPPLPLSSCQLLFLLLFLAM